MKLLRHICVMAKMLAFSAALWAGLATAAWAQGTGSDEEGGGSYLLSYALVILAVGLGLLVVCKSSGRRDREKPEQYGERKKLLDD